MKILMVDKFFFIKGGAERYYFELKKLLEDRGHEVIPFSMQHPENFETPYEKDFVDDIEFNGLTTLEKFKHAPKIISRVVYSKRAKEAVCRLIEREKPDIAHLHMIDHQISPSILHAFRDKKIPVVQTCHQYKLVCPSYRLFVMHKNRICEKCIKGHFYHAILERCHKESLSASMLVAAESYIHRMMKIYDLIDVFHVPSRFLGQKLIEGGFPQNKIWHSFYTINLEDYPFHPEAEDYFIYYGRLSEEKGVLTLLKAMQKTPNAKLLIAGDGPHRAALEGFASANGLKNVTFLGNQHNETLIPLIQKSRFVVVPSEWYDNSPLVIYESFSMGKPVISSTLGGMPELIEHGKSGLHFTAGNVDALAASILQLWDNREACQKMGRHARKTAEKEFSPEAHYQKIINLYEKMLSAKHTERAIMPFEDSSAVVAS